MQQTSGVMSDLKENRITLFKGRPSQSLRGMGTLWLIKLSKTLNSVFYHFMVFVNVA